MSFSLPQILQPTQNQTKSSISSPMEDRKDDDDGGDPIIARPRDRKSFSQPLGRDAAILAAPKRSNGRKHSLDAVPDTAAADDFSVPSSGSNRTLSHPNYQYASPPPSYHHRQVSSSSEDVRYPNPNFPQTLGSHHHGGSFMSSDGDPITLDRAMSAFGGAPGTLPEFTGTGGGIGIFRVPVRAAMHPARPPALELRPHPLRETQFGEFLRTIACTDTQILAGQESGLRFWNMSDVFEGWNGGSGVKRGDEESAPFKESVKTSPTLCLIVDTARGLIWSGHKDGKIRSWRIDKDAKAAEKNESDGDGDGGSCHFKEGLGWQAHRTRVLCFTISSYGNSFTLIA